MTERIEGQTAKDPAMWSRAFAQKIGSFIGFPPPEADATEASIRKEAEALLSEMTEDFRYLAGEQWNWVEQLSRFLIQREGDWRQTNENQAALWILGRPLSRRLELLRHVRNYLAFLRMEHGSELPADESDEWSDEDRRDCQLDAWRRLDEEDPYPWPEAPDDAHAG